LNKRAIADKLLIGFFWVSGLLILLVLVAIISYLIWRGGPFISREFILGNPAGIPLGSEGGIYPAIKGTLWLVLLALVLSVIPGLLTAIYLSEYGGSGGLAEIINLLVQSMTGVPSIVIGLFVYALGVVTLGWGISLLAGGTALAIMIYPVIVISSRDALRAVDENYRLIANSLGVSKSYTLYRVILPRAAAGIIAGILLSLGYAAGATAPIMVTAAAVIANSSAALFEPVMALPYHLYILFNEVVKNLFIRDDKKKRFFLIVLQKDKRANLKEIRKQLNSRPLSFASEKYLDKYLGLDKGAVSPFGILNDTGCIVEVVVDKDILAFEHIGVPPNDNTATLWIRPQDLESIIRNHGNVISYIDV
jgi:phosphate transport system permease protein